MGVKNYLQLFLPALDFVRLPYFAFLLIPGFFLTFTFLIL
jgi:hypothetical protein